MPDREKLGNKYSIRTRWTPCSIFDYDVNTTLRAWITARMINAESLNLAELINGGLRQFFFQKNKKKRNVAFL